MKALTFIARNYQSDQGMNVQRDTKYNLSDTREVSQEEEKLKKDHVIMKDEGDLTT